MEQCKMTELVRFPNPRTCSWKWVGEQHKHRAKWNKSQHKLRAIFVLVFGDFPAILQRTFRFIRYLLFFPSNSRTGCLDTKRRTWDAGKSFFELHFCAGSHRLLSFITSKKSSPTRHCQTEWHTTRKAKASMSCWESEQKPGWQK